ncbi:MAG: hypothetical protein AB1428_12270 [Bacteroidota bacterium]
MKINRILPATPIPCLLGVTVGDFWSWAYTDALSNPHRSAFTEFLVASALGVRNTPPTTPIQSPFS